VDPRTLQSEWTGGVRPVDESVREESQVRDAGEDRADGKKNAEGLPRGKITDQVEEYREQEECRQDPDLLGKPESRADQSPGESPEDRHRDSDEKQDQWFPAKPVLDRKKAEDGTGNQGKEFQKISQGQRPESAVHI